MARVALILNADIIGLFLKVQRQGKSALPKAVQHFSDGGIGLGPDTAGLHDIRSAMLKPHDESPAAAISIPTDATITSATKMTSFCFASIISQLLLVLYI